MESQRREKGLDLEAFLNPKSKVSTPATLFHILWLKKWKLLAVWALIAIPAATFLAVYDIPKTYSSVAYVRFPRVTGGQNGPVRDVSLGEAESVVRLFHSQKVLMKTIEDMGLRMEVTTKEVFRKYVIQDIAYSDKTPAGRYRLEFPGERRVKVEYRPWGTKKYATFFEGRPDSADNIPIPGGHITLPKPLAEVSKGFEVEMLFRTPDEALADFGERLKVMPLDKGSVAVNYSVELQDRDPYLVADVVNHLTDNFIRVYTGANENQDQDVLAKMRDNIAAARATLDKASDRLSVFYDKYQGRLAVKEGNPYALASAQTQKAQIETNLDRLSQTLAGRPGPNDSAEAKTLWMNEALALLSGQGIQRAEALRARMTDLERKKMSLSTQYNPAHPMVLAVDDEMAALFPSVSRLADDTRALYRTRLSEAGSEIARNLPGGGGDMGLTIEAQRLTQERDNAAKALENLQGEYDRAKLGAGPNLFEVNVMDAARPPTYEPPSLKGRLVFSAAAVVVAFFPGLFWMLLMQILFPRIWNKDDAERMLKVKVVGSLFHMGGRPVRRMPSKSQGGKPIDDCLLHHGRFANPSDVEAYRALRVELEHRFGTDPGRGALTILVASTQPNEGKSTLAANLAIGFARRGRRTLLVDADFRHGRQERIFGYGPQRGLIDLLRGGVDPDFGRRAHGMELPTVQAGLSLMPKGHYDESATEAAYRAPMDYYLKLMRAAYEVVIVDGPPVIVTADPLNFASMCNGVLYVLRSGQVSAREASRALEPFLEREIPMVGAVNGIRQSPADENYYARYGYYYQPDDAMAVTEADPQETRVGT
jgi:Mrp family chromosome partitioning ATPase